MYYPKSQIKEGLYTSGREYTLLNGKEYVGYYYALANGEFYSETPSSSTSQQLIKYPEGEDYIDFPPSPEVTRYNRINKINPKYVVDNITSSTPTPTEEDYKNGEFLRYFCKRINNLLYLEVNKSTFEKLNNQINSLYTPFTINWILVGELTYVYRTNMNIVELEMQRKKLSQFNKFLKEDYTKYHKYHK